MPRMVAQAAFPRRSAAASRRSLRRHPVRRRGSAWKIPDSIFGSYIDEPLCMVKADNSRYFFSTNDLYSVYALTDATGAVVERYMYDPYGKVTVLDPDGLTARTATLYGNPWTFTGRRLDGETGLMYFRNRIYSVDLGRFVSRDPIGYRGGMGLYGAYFVPLSVDHLGLTPPYVGLGTRPVHPTSAPDKKTVENSRIKLELRLKKTSAGVPRRHLSTEAPSGVPLYRHREDYSGFANPKYNEFSHGHFSVDTGALPTNRLLFGTIRIEGYTWLFGASPSLQISGWLEYEVWVYNKCCTRYMHAGVGIINVTGIASAWKNWHPDAGAWGEFRGQRSAEDKTSKPGAAIPIVSFDERVPLYKWVRVGNLNVETDFKTQTVPGIARAGGKASVIVFCKQGQ